MRKNSPINVHADVTSGARGLMFDLSPPISILLYARSEGSDEPVHMHKLV